MDNKNNIFITKADVEGILNYFGNIGDEDKPLEINNLEYFQRAFVHESYFQDIQECVKNNTISNMYIPCESSERLEFLGDHIIKAVMGRYLFERFSSEREGFLTKIKIKIEKCSMLHQFGIILGFKRFLLLSSYAEYQNILDFDRGRNTPSYYEDAFEAFIGSIIMDFGDKGFIYANRFIINVIENVVDFPELIANNDNFKDSLQRFFQSKHWQVPKYYGIEETGPSYRKMFKRVCIIKQECANSLSEDIHMKIKETSDNIINYFKINDNNVYKTLLGLQRNFGGSYIIGIGDGKKIIEAEQLCAKQSLTTLGLSLNY